MDFQNFWLGTKIGTFITWREASTSASTYHIPMCAYLCPSVPMCEYLAPYSVGDIPHHTTRSSWYHGEIPKICPSSSASVSA